MQKGAIYIATILNFLILFFVGGNSCLLSNNYLHTRCKLVNKDVSLLNQLGKKYFLQLREEGDPRISELKINK
jgi:hypothetical protein